MISRNVSTDSEVTRLLIEMKSGDNTTPHKTVCLVTRRTQYKKYSEYDITFAFASALYLRVKGY